MTTVADYFATCPISRLFDCIYYLLKFMENFDDVLAQLVARYPAIWDKRCRDFKNKAKKENAIREIAAILSCAAEQVVSRFKALREKYRKKKIKLAGRSESGQLDFEPWHLMDTLSFLDAVQVSRKHTETALSIVTQEQSISNDHCYFSPDSMSSDVITWVESSEDMENVADETQIEEPTRSTCSQNDNTWQSNVQQKKSLNSASTVSVVTQAPTQKKLIVKNSPSPLVFKNKKKKKEEEQTNVTSLIDRIANAAEATCSYVKGPEDHISAFGNFVISYLKRLPEKECDDAMFEITDILREKIKKN